MSDVSKTEPAKRPIPTRPWFTWLSLALFGVGCLSAAGSAMIRDINGDKLGLLSAAVVLIPIGALGIMNAHTALVRAELLERVEELDRRLREREGGDGGVPPAVTSGVGGPGGKQSLSGA